jgi:hypothetical protein
MSKIGLIAATLLLTCLSPLQRTGAAEYAAECHAPDGPVEITIGHVDCQRIRSDAVGGITAFAYYVPPGCVDKTCPVLYLPSGTDGDYRHVITPEQDLPDDQPWRNSWVKALTSGPPVDPHTVADPWNYGSPTTWVPQPPLDFVLVGPNNQTVPGGYGPPGRVGGGWADWNPKYAAGGSQPKYNTPPPRLETHLIAEVIPWVEQHLPVGRGREYRAIAGHSQSGLGAMKLGLQHPDVFATFTALSGASIPLGYIPGAAAVRDIVPGIGAPAGLPYTALPGVTSTLYPDNPPADPAGINWIPNALRAWFVGLGDPVADEAYWRGNMTQDLAMNARAYTGDVQSVPVDLFAGDGIRRDGQVYAESSALEVFARYIVGMQQIAFDSEEVDYHFEMHTGDHGSGGEFRRFQLERMYDRVRHADGTGSPAPAPDRFDFRSIRADFGVWGWHFAVDREPLEFLNIRDASCSSITLQGSGVATVSVPASCGTGVDGSSTFTVDLGPSYPTDEHAMASYTGAYNAATTIDLSAI